ncbi:ABC transporter ATP-binding protein [Brevibacterium yomogidense]|uniref:ABC transporter ATP-binding protein n=1 Tax=Brevibacterium yomogidense TaxID=946573 RepID=UPI0018DFDBE7|nr:ABC transporter ATP-binding protein [Brevibacterium yomogidense]
MDSATFNGRSSHFESSTRSLLAIEDLNVSLGGTQLLQNVSLSLKPGELVGLVGESGSGKTLTGLGIMGLLPNTATVTGTVRYDGSDLLTLDAAALRDLRGDHISMIFQEPRASLHPSRTVGRQMIDVLLAHETITRKQAQARAMELLDLVGLPNPRRTMNVYTHALSGGMCQRILIAMALLCNPRLLIADEPTTALDVTIQAQVIELLRRLAEEFDLAVLLITHNLGVVASLCSRIVTMYCGQIVNDDATDRLLTAPQHPYPAALLKASDVHLESPDDWTSIAGSPANPARPPAGCRFHPRCPYAELRCSENSPILEDAPNGGRSRCLRIDELTLDGVA